MIFILLKNAENAILNKNKVILEEIAECLVTSVTKALPNLDTQHASSGSRIINSELDLLKTALCAKDKFLFYELLELGLNRKRAHYGFNAPKESYQKLHNVLLQMDSKIKRQGFSKALYDFSFLYPDPSQVKQSVLGKVSNKKRFFTDSLKSMKLGFWSSDNQYKVKYLTSQEKKAFKIRKVGVLGVLKRAIDKRPLIKDGEYLYIISPKGSLYAAQATEISRINHSSFRAGQPVLCAGNICIDNGKISDINNSSGHYEPDFEQLMFACMQLFQQQMLTEDCTISAHGHKMIYVNELLTNRQYQSYQDTFKPYLRKSCL